MLPSSSRPLLISPLSVVMMGLTAFLLVSIATHAPSRSVHPLATIITPPAATPPPSVPPTYPNAPHLGVSGVAAIAPPSGSTITQDLVMSYVHLHPLPFAAASNDQTKVTSIGEFPSSVVATRLGVSTGLPDTTLLWYVEMAGNFVFPGNGQQPAGVSFPYAYEAFIAESGNLVLVGGLAQSTSSS